MAPSLLLLMRHAEKPADPVDPDLSPAGLQRAQKLADYIPDTFGALDFLLASAISRHSARPYETIKPLSKKIGVPIDSSCADNDYGAFASALLSDPRYSGKKVLVAWHHGNIPSMADALGAPTGQYPNPWDPAVFNLILKFDWGADGPPAVTAIVEPF
jgi:broad specificity phosphatase PhoE